MRVPAIHEMASIRFLDSRQPSGCGNACRRNAKADRANQVVPLVEPRSHLSPRQHSRPWLLRQSDHSLQQFVLAGPIWHVHPNGEGHYHSSSDDAAPRYTSVPCLLVRIPRPLRRCRAVHRNTGWGLGLSSLHRRYGGICTHLDVCGLLGRSWSGEAPSVRSVAGTVRRGSGQLRGEGRARRSDGGVMVNRAAGRGVG